jgi:hypothetical protein
MFGGNITCEGCNWKYYNPVGNVMEMLRSYMHLCTFVSRSKYFLFTTLFKNVVHGRVLPYNIFILFISTLDCGCQTKKYAFFI